MKFLDTFLLAVHNLKRNKLRTFLTMLGIIIGVFAVVALVAVVTGFSNFITDTFNSIGSDLIAVAPGKVDFGKDPSLAFMDNKLDMKHLNLIETYASDYIEDITPTIRLSRTLSYRNKKYIGAVIGTNERALNIIDANISTGAFFTRADVIMHSKVVVLGAKAYEELFNNQPALGKNINIAGKNFEVIGILKPKGFRFDNRVIVPYTSLKDVTHVSNLSGFSIKASPNYSPGETVSQVKRALLRDLKPDDFTVLSQEEILSSVQTIMNVITVGLGAVASISLIVGSIGIMNIMLVAVNERISEIGLLKAVGATSKDITLLFLLEAMLIGIVGGLLGLLLGIGITLALRSFIHMSIPLWAVFLSLGFSAIVGTISGTYPAMKAGKKHPIEALHYE